MKLEYMTRENISMVNFLFTFGMVSESCLNNLHPQAINRKSCLTSFVKHRMGRLGNKLCCIYQITQQETSWVQFMLEFTRNMCKAYTDLATNFITSLINIVILTRCEKNAKGGKISCLQTLQETGKSPCVQSHGAFIQDQLPSSTDI